MLFFHGRGFNPPAHPSTNRNTVRSFSCAFRGLPVLFSTQRNIRVHLCFPVLAAACGFFLGISSVKWSLVFLASGSVLADVVHPGQHPQSGRVKDIAAGAVLITVIAAAGIGLMIFLPRLT
jgi:diacylglycerol kinase